jgi:HD-like signal output (HDOD) protein
LVEEGGESFINAEQKILGCTHQDIGKFLAQKWELPASLCHAMEHHHKPQEAPENTMLVSIIHLADCMTHEFKIGETFWDENADFETDVSDVLGFKSLEELAEFTSEYRVVFEDTANSIKL